MIDNLTDECVVGCKYGDHHLLCGLIYSKNVYLFPDRLNEEYVLSRKEKLRILLPDFIIKYKLNKFQKDYMTRKRYNVFIKLVVLNFKFSQFEVSKFLCVDLKHIKMSFELADIKEDYMDDFKEELMNIDV
jgi:hypothetical protein